MKVARYRLVIFDNDGVLVDSEPIANRAICSLFAESGIIISLKDAADWYTGNSPSSIRGITQERLGRNLPPDFESRYAEAVLHGFEAGLKPIEGIGDVLDVLDEVEDCAYCVASNGSHERIDRALKAANLGDRFIGRAFSADEVDAGKPSPDLLIWAARRMQVRPELCVVIEDSASGSAAANTAGMTTIGLASLGQASKLQDATGGIVKSARELIPLLVQDAPECSSTSEGDGS
jgi:HAD superfamily hydrolase (TIGR01509 family)